MTTATSSRGPTEVINARRTESVDAPAIHGLVSARTISQFGHVNIVHLIEKSNLSVTLNNEENEILGFAGFMDYPPARVCDAGNWEEWMSDMEYMFDSLTSPLNSLFLHYFAAKDDYTIGCASEIVRTVFNAVPELRFIYLTLSPEAHPEPALAELFSPVERRSTGGSSCTLYVCHRHQHVPLLHIRPAVVEDHDDLIPIFKRLNNTLTETYGNYFLAEMIEAQDEDNHALVAEVGGKAIGFISVSAHVNVDLLQNCYELDSFHGLCKPHDGDILEEERVEEAEEDDIAAEESFIEKASTATEVVDPSKPSVTSMISQSEATERSKSVKEDAASSTYAGHGGGGGGGTTVEGGFSNEISNTSVGSAPTTVTISKLSEAHMTGSSESMPQDVISEEADVEEDLLLNDLPRVQVVEPVEQFKPVYLGDSNVFSIQLFCIDEQYEMRSADFLPEIFKWFPDKDMVAITVPHLVPEFPLLQQFVRVTPKSGANSPHELYVFHRHGLISSKFKVRPAQTSDYEQVESLVKNIHMKEVLLDDLRLFNSARRDSDGTEIQGFVATCMQQVVGICIIRREEDIEYVRSHYNIEDFIYFNHHRRDEHSHMHHFVLNPIFQHFAKHFMKEVLRQGRKSCLYYPVFPPDTEFEFVTRHSLITGLNFMVPVRARPQVDYPLDKLGINAPSHRVIGKARPYALNHINRKLTLEPKVTVNARIVIVGASDVAIAFLESICFCPHLRFNNLTLISKRGLPPTLRSTASIYTAEDLAYLSLRSWVNIVQGVMTGIDRSRKQVTMADGAVIPYDHLILCTGQQFQIPMPSGADVRELQTNHDLPKGTIKRPYDVNQPVPENVKALNDDADYFKLHHWTSKIVGKLEKEHGLSSIVIYGGSVEAYSTVEYLLSWGIPGSKIVMALPPPENTSLSVSDDGCNGDPFNEPTVSEVVAAALADAGVTVLVDHVLAEWEVEETITGAKITSVSFTTPTKPVISLPCSAFLSLHPKRIDHLTFLASNDSCLVFDGRLAIDAHFKTNDRYVRAAGSLTKYTRRYYADSHCYMHENYNSREIGFRLAMTILPLFDPTLDGGNEQIEEQFLSPQMKPETPGSMLAENPHDKLVPVYVEPKICYCDLPGGFKYLHIRKPGDRILYAAQLNDADHGKEIVTGSPKHGNYFRLHINQYRCVETITCLVKPEMIKIPLNNMRRLYGIHERYLNNLLGRAQEGLILDLFAFFHEPWATAIFHDRFQDFRQEVRDLLSSGPPGTSNIPSLDAQVRQLIEEDLVISDQQRAKLQQFYSSTGQKKAVETRLLSFLSYNYYHLPMYAKPGMV